MYFQKYPVSPALRPFIKYYYVLKGHDLLYETHPQGTFDLIFGQPNGSEFRGEKTVKPTHKATTLMFAQQEKHFDIYLAPHSRVYSVSFKPEGFYKILKFPLGEMINLMWDISDHLPKSYQYLYEQVLESKTDEQAIQILENFFMREFYKANAVLSPFDQLLHFIRQKNGNIRVEEMAQHLNVSRRTLNRLFAKHLGITPKSYSSIVRFQQAILNYYERPNFGWSGVLYDMGYYNQNHFIKDFKRYTGKTPTRFLNTDRTFSDFFLKD